MVNLWCNILRLTLKRTGNQDHRTISLYSYQKVLSWTNSLYCSNHIRWIKLFLCSLQGLMCNDVGTLKIQSTGNFHHRNLRNIFFKGQKKRLLTNGILCGQTKKNIAKLQELVQERCCRQDKWDQNPCPVAWPVDSQLFYWPPKSEWSIDSKFWNRIRDKLTFLWIPTPPKYKNSPFKVTPQPP